MNKDASAAMIFQKLAALEERIAKLEADRDRRETYEMEQRERVTEPPAGEERTVKE